MTALTISPVLLAVGLTALQRLAELGLARDNTRRLLAMGGVEHGRRHYPLLVGLHAAWLVSLALVVPWDRPAAPTFLGAFIVLQLLRLWILWTLGSRWTTRIITLPGEKAVRRGPYRLLRHPNYLIVALEILVLPLAFGAWAHALLFSALNAALLLLIRIPAEERALIGLRAITPVAGRP